MFSKFLDRIEDVIESRCGAVCFANTIYPVHAQDITDRALMSFKSHCVGPRYVDRQYDKLWGQTGAKRGTTINLRIPPVYELRRGDKAQPQGSNESFFPITLGTPTGVDLDFTSQELLLTVDDFMNRFIKKAVLPIANGVDSDIMALYKKVNSFVGTPAVVPTSIDTYLSATTALANNGAPVEASDDWTMLLDYKSNQKIVNALAGQYNPQTGISRQWETARMKQAIGYKWDQDQNIKIHTVGALGSTPLVNLGGQSGSAINCDGGSNSVTRYWGEGDIISFAGVYGIKPNSVPLGGSGESTGELMQFAITQDTDSSAAGVIVANISPPMVLSGAGQNVTNAPADNAAVTTFGHASTYAGALTRQNLAFDKSAFVLGAVDLPLPGGMDMAARTTDEDTKLSIRFLRGFDIGENTFISRLDMLYVTACPRPQFACRVVG